MEMDFWKIAFMLSPLSVCIKLTNNAIKDKAVKEVFHNFLASCILIVHIVKVGNGVISDNKWWSISWPKSLPFRAILGPKRGLSIFLNLVD